MFQSSRLLNAGLVLAIVLTLGIAAARRASSATEGVQESATKLIYVQGSQSFLMNGDAMLNNVDVAAGGGNALPYMLGHGWKIRSVNVSDSPDKGSAAGYIVIER